MDCGEALLLNSWRNTEVMKAFRIESQVGNQIQKAREGSPKGSQAGAPRQAALRHGTWRGVMRGEQWAMS